MSRQAVGWRCPECGEDEAYILDLNLPQMELECYYCGRVWAVEP